ncbi:hypothetical protein QUC31_016290 [Theobroma cacao]|nr:Casparian strip membrane protein domain - like 10 [Theobroma cacao]
MSTVHHLAINVVEFPLQNSSLSIRKSLALSFHQLFPPKFSFSPTIFLSLYLKLVSLLPITLIVLLHSLIYLFFVNMESQNNGKVSAVDGVGSKREVATPRKVNSCDLILRVLALLLTLVAAIVLGVNKQTKVVPIQIAPTLPPLNIEAQARWHYLSAFVYAMVSNIIACSYAAISILMVMGTRNAKKGLAQTVILLLDLVMVALLFSANGAAFAIGLMGYKGNSHVRWNKVCNVFDKFCNQVAVFVVLSMLGSVAFMLLVALAAATLHKRCK